MTTKDIIFTIVLFAACVYLTYYLTSSRYDKTVLEKDEKITNLQTSLETLKRSNDSIVYYLNQGLNKKDNLLNDINTKATVLKQKYETIKDIKPNSNDSLLLWDAQSIINYPTDQWR